MYTYIYPITRFGELETTIVRNTKLSDTEDDVMSFYDDDISQKDLERIIKAYNSGRIQDIFNYIKTNIIERNPRYGNCTYSEIMGGCHHYEGMTKIGENTFKICLGS